MASFASREYREGLEHAVRAHGTLVAAFDRAGITIPMRWTGHTLTDQTAALEDVGSLLEQPGAYMFVDDLRAMR